ncbi:hypothetical protein [Sphingomicrobium clamense]|uniref:Lipoprotein n=1 Tax=Sphingomicrobium clamense TaxID=2851013 RepID=A0ABS6V534_9SPHN|nr:hypothetical protein [Sphingomicrobium sp. B8]MBW0144666.1 hypothetical protein [Sphingomicrobium sp. B8]
MKKLILLAGVASLAACADTAVEEEAPAEDAAMEAMAEEEAPTAPDGGPMAGSYSLRDMDGNETGVTTINEDGTYTYVDADGTEVSGTMTMDGDTACFDPDGDDPAVCYPNGGMTEEGEWIRVDPDGNEVGTIVRLEADA